MNKLNIKWINLVATKFTSLHQIESTEATLLRRKSAEIASKCHTNIENMRQSENKI